MTITVTPPPADDATCTQRNEIPTYNPEFAPEHDAGPCPRTPVVARLSIRHDGTSCGCDGRCLFDEQNIDELLEPWTEVRLLCADHLHEYQATIGGLQQPPVRTLEDLA